MLRSVTEVPLGESRVRCKVVLADSVECEPGTPQSTMRQYEMMRQLADAPQVTACGPEPFQTCRWYHNGKRWMVELEAEVRRA